MPSPLSTPGQMLPNSCTTMKSCGRFIPPPAPSRWPSHSFLQPIHGFYSLILLTLCTETSSWPMTEVNLSKKSYFPDIRQLGLEANVKAYSCHFWALSSPLSFSWAVGGSQSSNDWIQGFQTHTGRGNWAIPRGHQCLEGAAPIPAVWSHSHFSLNVTLFSNIQNSIRAIPRLLLMKTNWAPIL